MLESIMWHLMLSCFKSVELLVFRFRIAQRKTTPCRKPKTTNKRNQLRRGFAVVTIPNNNEGYDRALKILKEEYGQESVDLASHTREIINLSYLKSSGYLHIKELYETLRTNSEALRAMRRA